MRYATFPGIRPINGYIWAASGPGSRIRMLFTHARFIPRVFQRTLDTFLINRTEGPRWPYPWQKR